jgi:thiol-disulfide isomerase/thioredoxin
MKGIQFVFLIFFAFSVVAQSSNIVFDEIKNQEIIYGICTPSDFRENGFENWFVEEYNNYIVNEEVFVPGYEVKFDSIYVLLASWCGDSRREVPRFCKIMDHPYFEGTNVKYFGFDASKQNNIVFAEDLYLQFVPTFIFYYKGNELCRIVEEPKDSLEEDIMDLLSRIQP